MGVMPLGIGATEIIIVLVIVLVIFGPKRLPDLGRSLGRGMREFKDSVTGNDKDELPESTQVTSTKVTSTKVTADQPDPAATAPEPKP
jgi:sec-independent protein translocase protein TatA